MKTKPKLVLASNNDGKIREIKHLMGHLYEIVTMGDMGYTADIEETGSTFYENAYIKAKAIHDALGVAAIADDSGLCVEALGGAPGIHSARYATDHDNEANIVKLLADMENIADRRASFVCCMVLIDIDGQVFSGMGEVHGTLNYSKIGTQGFGYDPIFHSAELDLSFGIATPAQKNSVSHRQRAITALLSTLHQ